MKKVEKIFGSDIHIALYQIYSFHRRFKKCRIQYFLNFAKSIFTNIIFRWHKSFRSLTVTLYVKYIQIRVKTCSTKASTQAQQIDIQDTECVKTFICTDSNICYKISPVFVYLHIQDRNVETRFSILARKGFKRFHYCIKIIKRRKAI